MYCCLTLSFLIALFATNAPGDEPHSEVDLEKKASLIVVGEVEAVYVNTQQWAAPKDPRLGYDEQKRYIVEIKVDSVEKGEEIEAGSLIYARLMQTRSRVDADGEPEGPRGGHTAIPQDREKGRFYLQEASNQFYSVVGPNGYELIPRKPLTEKEAKAARNTPPIAEAPPVITDVKVGEIPNK